MLTPEAAVQHLTEQTRGCPLPVVPQAFRRRRYTPHDRVFFGPAPVRTYKRKGRWWFDEDDIHQAARTLAAFPWDPHDLVEAQLPSRAPAEENTRPGADWRRSIRHSIEARARHARFVGGCECGGPGPERLECEGPAMKVADGLPCGLTWPAFLDHAADLTMACLRPVPSLHWAGDTWMIPRALQLLLDGWQEAEHQLADAAGRCQRCGERGDARERRAATAGGWRVLCPPCAAATLSTYQGELTGAPYARARSMRAEDFLCVLCPEPRPASGWDHCHDHDQIRGPLCTGCNLLERGKLFLDRAGAVPYLLRCEGCRRADTLPRHHQLPALQDDLHLRLGDPDCPFPRHFCVAAAELGDDGWRFTLRCPDGARQRQAVLTRQQVQAILTRIAAHGAQAD